MIQWQIFDLLSRRRFPWGAKPIKTNCKKISGQNFQTLLEEKKIGKLKRVL